MMEQKINEENIENNLAFCIDPRKAFAIKSISRSVLRQESFLSHRCPLFQQWICGKAASGLGRILCRVLVNPFPHNDTF